MRGTNYEGLLRRFFSLEKRGMKLSLHGTRALLKKLGTPQHSFSSILVGGTNGKGSTCAFISSVLRSAGYSVGLYTSPHLIDFRERIRVSGECIPREAAHELLAFLVPTAEREGSSFFETVTALAFRFFKDANVDCVVAEVGLGGRLDSTNVLNPLVSVVSGVAIEHGHILGRTLDSIAGEKAGIFRRRRPVVTAAEGGALEKLSRVSRSLDAPMYRVGRELKLRARFVSRGGSVFSISHLEGPLRLGPRLFSIGLRGKHQIRNAGCALLTGTLLREMGCTIEDGAFESGLKRAQWPGRLEECISEPLILFDVAHNPQAASSLRDALETLYHDREVVAVIGMVREKDHRGFLRRILPRVRHAVFTRASCARAVPARELAERMPSPFPHVSVKECVKDALGEAISIARDDDLVCVTGSFYTVGEAMRCMGIRARESL